MIDRYKFFSDCNADCYCVVDGCSTGALVEWSEYEKLRKAALALIVKLTPAAAPVSVMEALRVREQAGAFVETYGDPS